MAVFAKKAETYAAFQYPSSSDYQSRINIYTADNYRLYVLFYDDDATLPSNSYNNKTGVAYEHASRYAAYLDLLRHEDPVWVTFNEEAKSFVVYAAYEPVGEAEMMAAA